MIPDDKTTAPDLAPSATHAEPPRVYLPACGVLCDVFWWARRDCADDRATVPVSKPGKRETNP